MDCAQLIYDRAENDFMAGTHVGATGLSAAEIVDLAVETACQVLWMEGGLDEAPELHDFLYRQWLPPTEADILNPGDVDGRMSLAIGGVCADKIEGRIVNITDGRFDSFIIDILTGLKGTLGQVVTGGTMWSFMPAVARTADRVARVMHVGIMPQQGLSDLRSVRGLFRGTDALPRMDTMVIAGETYQDARYASAMADASHGMINIGGRAGARNEVEAMRQRRKPVYLAPVELNADIDWLKAQVMAGLVFPKNAETLVKILRNDFVPYPVRTMRPGLSYRDHLSPHQFKARHIEDVVVGIVSTSGAKTDTRRMKKILGPLMRGVQQNRANAGKIVGLGGMTMLGGISVFYNVCLDANIETAGIMCWRGANEILARGASEMVIVGDEWSDESPYFLDLIDILLVVEPGNQGWKEALQASKSSSTKGSIPIIVIKDPVLAHGREYPDIPGASYIDSKDLPKVISWLNLAVDQVIRQRRIIP